MKPNLKELLYLLSEEIKSWEKTLIEKKELLAKKLNENKIPITFFEAVLPKLPTSGYNPVKLALQKITDILPEIKDFGSTEVNESLNKILCLNLHIIRYFITFLAFDSEFLNTILYFEKILTTHLPHCYDYFDLLLAFESVFSAVSLVEFTDFKLGYPTFSNTATTQLDDCFEKVISSLAGKNIRHPKALGLREDPKIDIVLKGDIVKFSSLQNLSTKRTALLKLKKADMETQKARLVQMKNYFKLITPFHINISFVDFFLLKDDEDKLIQKIEKITLKYIEYIELQISVVRKMTDDSTFCSAVLPAVKDLLMLLSWTSDYYYLNLKFAQCKKIVRNKIQTWIDRLSKSTGGQIFSDHIIVETLARISGSYKCKLQFMKYFSVQKELKTKNEEKYPLPKPQKIQLEIEKKDSSKTVSTEHTELTKKQTKKQRKKANRKAKKELAKLEAPSPETTTNHDIQFINESNQQDTQAVKIKNDGDHALVTQKIVASRDDSLLISESDQQDTKVSIHYQGKSDKQSIKRTVIQLGKTKENSPIYKTFYQSNNSGTVQKSNKTFFYSTKHTALMVPSKPNHWVHKKLIPSVPYTQPKNQLLVWKPKQLSIPAILQPISNQDMKLPPLDLMRTSALQPRGWLPFADLNQQVNANISKYFSFLLMPKSIRNIIYILNNFCEENKIEQPYLTAVFVRRLISAVFNNNIPLYTNHYHLGIPRPQNVRLHLLLTQKLLELNGQFDSKKVLYSIILYENQQKTVIDIHIMNAEEELKSKLAVDSFKTFISLNSSLQIFQVQVLYHTDFFKNQTAIIRKFAKRTLNIGTIENIFSGANSPQTCLLNLASFSILENWTLTNKTIALLQKHGPKLYIKNKWAHNFQQHKIYLEIALALSEFILNGSGLQYKLLDLFCHLKWLTYLYGDPTENKLEVKSIFNDDEILLRTQETLRHSPELNIKNIYDLYQAGCGITENYPLNQSRTIHIINFPNIANNIFNFFNILQISYEFGFFMPDTTLLNALLKDTPCLSNEEFKFYWYDIASKLSCCFSNSYISPKGVFSSIQRSGALAKLFAGSSEFCDKAKLNYFSLLKDAPCLSRLSLYFNQPNSIAILFLIGELLLDCLEDKFEYLLSQNVVTAIAEQLLKKNSGRFQYIIAKLTNHQIIDLFNFTCIIIKKATIFQGEYKSFRSPSIVPIVSSIKESLFNLQPIIDYPPLSPVMSLGK